MCFSPEEPVNKIKTFLHQKTVVLFFSLIAINKIKIPECDRGQNVVQVSIVASLLIRFTVGAFC